MALDPLQAPPSRGYTVRCDGRLEGCVSLERTVRSEAGQGLVEYSLIILLIVLIAIPSLDLIGVSVTGFLEDAADQI